MLDFEYGLFSIALFVLWILSKVKFLNCVIFSDGSISRVHNTVTVAHSGDEKIHCVKTLLDLT